MISKFGTRLLPILLVSIIWAIPNKEGFAQTDEPENVSSIPENVLNEVQIERMLNRVKDLSSPAFTGRELGTLGNKKAADWLSYTLPQIGLEPLPSLGEYKHEFTVANYSIDDPASNRLKIRNNSFNLHEDFVPAYFSASDSVAGEAKFIDPGWDDSTLRDIAGSSQNPIALVYNDSYSQQLESFNQTNHLYSLSNRLADIGFQAILFIAPPAEKLPYSKTATNYRFEDDIDLPKDAAKYMSNTPRPYVLPRATSIPVMLISNETGNQLLSNLGVDMVVKQYFGQLNDKRDLNKNGDNSLEPTGANIKISVSISQDNEKSAYNVIGILPGTEESNLFSDPFVMLSANFDQEGQHPEAGTPFYGANNNATSIAAQLETAEILANATISPPHTIVFAFFNGRNRENSGLQAFISDSLVNLNNLTAGYNLLELAGSKDEDTTSVFISSGKRPHISKTIIDNSTSDHKIELKNSTSFINKLSDIYYQDSTVELLQKQFDLPYLGISGGYYTYSNRTLDSSDKLNLSQFYDLTRIILDVTWRSAHYGTQK